MWQANLLGVDGLCWWVLACTCPVVWRLGLGVGPVVCVHVLALAPSGVPGLLDFGTVVVVSWPGGSVL